MQRIAIIIPAAGASRRMRGADKLLELVDGQAMLRRQAQMALATGAHVAVCVPAFDHPRVAALAGLPVQLTTVPDSDLGMSASIRRGIARLPRDMRAAMILPADMPDLQTDDLLALINGFEALPMPMVQQATSEDGIPGHPVLFPADCFSSLTQLQGDEGARSVLRANAHRVRPVALPGKRALLDLDTPEAWALWRSRTPQVSATAAE